jgi:hypothetical protein
MLSAEQECIRNLLPRFLYFCARLFPKRLLRLHAPLYFQVRVVDTGECGNMIDMTTIEAALGLASTAVGVTSKAASTAEAFKKLFSSEKAPDHGEAMRLVNALATELTTANVMNVQLSESLRAISNELRKEDQFEQEKARYELVTTPYGDLVYKLRQDKANGEPMHYICPTCLKKDRLITIIQGDTHYKACQNNSAHGFTFNLVSYSADGDNSFY